MRTIRPGSSLSPSAPPSPPASVSGEAVQPGILGLRLVDGVLLDLPLPVPAGARCWVATVWPDHRSATGWAGRPWLPDLAGGRGWRWPARIAVGDVVEFGVELRSGRRQTSSSRWWGVIADYDGSWLLSLLGPHASPGQAQAAAGRLIQGRQPPAPAAPPPGVGASREPAVHRGRVRTHRT